MSEIPTTMTVVEITEAGSPEVLRAGKSEVPRPGFDEVLIEVHAAGVNRPDVMQRMGMYPPPHGVSPIPGLEIAGLVVAVGSGVLSVHIGDSVCALVPGGGYADYCVASVNTCLPVPQGFSMLEAAAIPETFFTVWSNVFDRGRLVEGEHLLVHGGTSGIGTTAIQLAKAFGAAVSVTAGTDQKCEFCCELGADLAINYNTQDFVEEIQTDTGGRGVDVILDMVGGEYFPRNLKSLALDGRLIQIALMKGVKSEMNLLAIMLKRLTITGSTLRPRSIEEKMAIRDALLANVWPLFEQRHVKPIVYETYPLIEAYKAHKTMESSEHIGNLVLTVR